MLEGCIPVQGRNIYPLDFRQCVTSNLTKRLSDSSLQFPAGCRFQEVESIKEFERLQSETLR